MTVGVCSTLVMIAFTLVTASTSGLTLAAVLVIIGFWVLTGAAATAAGYQQQVQRRSEASDEGEATSGS